VLCELINKFKPGSVAKINNSTMPFKKVRARHARPRLAMMSLLRGAWPWVAPLLG
jgi:hypothetical protein